MICVSFHFFIDGALTKGSLFRLTRRIVFLGLDHLCAETKKLDIKNIGVIEMRRQARKLSLVFSAGCLGGLVNSLAVWFFGLYGLTSAFNVKIAPQLSPPWLYPRILWGGIWGFLFLFPVLKNCFIWRGLFFSLGPTFVQLFVLFPLNAHKGMMGLDLGTLTPVFVIIYNAIWGLTAALWLRWIEKS